MEASSDIVSFVIATRNNERTLGRCLESILSQNFRKDRFEVIVVDGGSTDGTRRIAMQYGTRIVPNPSVHQDGPFGGRNSGLHASKGDFIVFLNADQFLSSPNWLLAMTRPLEADTTLAASISPLIADRGSPWLNRYNSYVESPFISTVSRLLGTRSIYEFFDESKNFGNEVVSVSSRSRILLFMGTGMVVRRRVLEAAGGYDFDLDTGFRAVQAGFRNYCLVSEVGFFHAHYRRSSILAYLSHKVSAIRWFLFFRNWNNRQNVLEDYLWQRNTTALKAWLISTLSAAALLGSLVEARRLFSRNKDPASFFHIVASIVSLMAIALCLFSESSGRELFTSRILKPRRVQDAWNRN